MDKIYIIEDEEITLLTVSDYLTKRGYQISGTSSTGEYALKDLEQIQTDIVLIDINLDGELDGIETAKEITSKFKYPVVYVTSDISPETINRIMATRPYGYVKKPIRFDSLHSTIQLALENFKTENKLKERESLLSLLYEGMKDYSIVLLKENGCILEWNKSAEALFGYKPQEMENKHYSILFHVTSPLSIESENLLLLSLKNHSVEKESYFQAQSGISIFCLFVITPLRNLHGDLKGFSLLFKNMTETKKIEEEKALFQKRLERYSEELEKKVHERTLELNSLNELLTEEIKINKLFEDQIIKTNKKLLDAQQLAHFGDWEFNLKTGETFLSPESHLILCITNSEDSKIQKLKNLIYPSIPEKEFIETLKKDKFYQYDKYISIPNNEKKYVNVNAKMILDENKEIEKIFGTILDITLRKNAELELNKALGKEIELNKMKNRFVNMITHEFRTPLTIIMSNVQLIERFAERYTENDRRSKFKNIYMSFKKLNELLDDILQLGRIQEKRLVLNYENIHLRSFLLKLISELSSTEYGQNRIELELNISEDFTIRSDSKILYHILNNLLINALKYSSYDKQIYFIIQVIDSTKVLFGIKDHGIGIPKEEQEKIFDSFFRSSNVGEKKGTGLGLSITKEYVDLLKGSIKVESVLGEFSYFTVLVPIQPNEI
jgi:PAS domain S-box-containing protein